MAKLSLETDSPLKRRVFDSWLRANNYIYSIEVSTRRYDKVYTFVIDDKEADRYIIMQKWQSI